MKKTGSGAAGFVILSALSLVGCGGSSSAGSGGGGGTTTPQAATPILTAAASQNGAQIVTMTDSTAGAAIYYTVDGTTPTTSSQTYLAPFLVASTEKVQALAVLAGDTNSEVASQSFTMTIPSGTLVWSDEFANTTGSPAQPNPAVWGYDTGAGGWGNSELENYCAWGSTTSPCSTSTPNAFVDTNGYLNIVAVQTASGGYTSARLKSEGLFSLQYGRLEFRAEVPEAQGLWPAAWMLGNNIATVNWPACGEQDVLERVNAPTDPDFNEGSVHGPGFTGTSLGTAYNFPAGVTASTWHTYGIIWSPGSVAYYVDDPTKPYVTYTPASLPAGATWPFDGGESNFIILNLAVGGDYPGPPDSSTPFPSTMLVDYVRLYTN